MSMPENLVFIRHGESEANVVHGNQYDGDGSMWNDAFRERHDSKMRLSEKGRGQAVETGLWLRDSGLGSFDRYYTTPHIRGIETAALLGLNPEKGWYKNDLIRERDWGEFGNVTNEERDEIFRHSVEMKDLSPWYWTPPGGESLASGVRLRFERVMDTMHREAEGENVIMVAHGELMWVARFVLERMDVSTRESLDDSPEQKIRNAMVLQYTRRDPEDVHSEGPLERRISWMRMICPWDESLSFEGGEWQDVEYTTYSDLDLLDEAAQFPNLL